MKLSKHDDLDSPRGFRQLLLLSSVFVIAACGLLYQLVSGAVASYLIGDAITQYSLVIGFFLAAMGIGSYLTYFIRSHLSNYFIVIQLVLSLVGGYSSIILFTAFSFDFNMSSAVLSFAMLIGCLVGMEIPLIIRMLRQSNSMSKSLSYVLSLDYLGALFASLTFPLFLLPQLGMIRSALVSGLLNLSVAGVAIYIFQKNLRHLKPYCFAIAGILIALCYGLNQSNHITQWVEASAYQDEIIVSKQSPFQKIVVTKWHDDIRLYLNGHLQFSTKDEYRYHESLVIPPLYHVSNEGDVSSPPIKALILGGGDGLAAQLLLKYPHVRKIDLVDLDKTVTEMFKNHSLLKNINGGSLNHEKLSIYHEDAYLYLQKSASPMYDLIIADLPDPSSESTAKLYSQSFFNLALKRLSARGSFITQATSPFFSKAAFWNIHETVSEAVRHSGKTNKLIVTPYHTYIPSFGDWGFVMVSTSRTPCAMQSKECSFGENSRYMNPEVFEAAKNFPLDIAKPPGQGRKPNMIAEPRLVQAYRDGWGQWYE